MKYLLDIIIGLIFTIGITIMVIQLNVSIVIALIVFMLLASLFVLAAKVRTE